MKIKTAFFGVAAAALVAVVFFAFQETRLDEKVAPKSSASANLFPFVKSMEGTQPDGNIRVAEDETLVVDAGLRRLFEYYLAATGEKSIAEITAEIEKELDRRLKPRAAREAKRLLARFIDYKRDLVNVEKNPKIAGNGVEAIRGRLVAMQQSRLRFFTAPEAQAMFGFDDAYDMDSVTRLEISQNKALTDAQKQERIAALDAAMPEELRKERDAPLIVVKLEESVQKMRAQGASDDDVYRMRAAALNPEAAARLSEVDRDEVAWKGRITAYLAERSKLMDGNARISESERQAALQRLRDAGFGVDEQKRLAAYE
jgi:lipase chaperone LimK